MARKLNKKLLALGTAAVITVYGAGYARTESAASALARSIATPAAAVASAPSTGATTAAPASSDGSATADAAAQLTSGYRDGTYTGSGSNRFGEVDVAVTIQNGRIASVEITRSLTHYPSASIAALPGEVVGRQSAQIDLVSGATYSSKAFRDAVSQALSQAQGATAASAAASAGQES